MALFRNFKNSALELNSIRCLTVTAFLIALDIALKSLSITIIPNTLKISFAFIALAAIGMLYGPTVSFLAGIITDVIGFFVYPTGYAFSPLFTFIEAFGAMLYGVFLYNLVFVKVDFNSIKNNSKTVWFQIFRIVIAKFSVIVICNLIMTPLANVYSGFMTFEAMIGVYPARLLKNAIQFPADCLILVVLLFPILWAYKSVFRDKAEIKATEQV